MTDTDPRLWDYDATGRAILPEWAKAAIDEEMGYHVEGCDCPECDRRVNVDDKHGNIGRLELPSRFDPSRTYSWPLYEAEIARILEQAARIDDPAKCYRFVYGAAKAASGCEPMVTAR